MWNQIGKFSMIGAGSVVTKSIPDHALFLGSPAKFKYWIDSSGKKLIKKSDSEYISLDKSEKYKLTGSILIKV